LPRNEITFPRKKTPTDGQRFRGIDLAVGKNSSMRQAQNFEG